MSCLEAVETDPQGFNKFQFLDFCQLLILPASPETVRCIAHLTDWILLATVCLLATLFLLATLLLLVTLFLLAKLLLLPKLLLPVQLFLLAKLLLLPKLLLPVQLLFALVHFP